MTSQATPYPLDYEELTKGSVVSTCDIETIVELRRDHRMFSLKAMSLASMIEQELAARHRPATVAVVKDTIRVLTDEEALVYSEKSFERGMRAMGRAHKRTLRITPELLSEGQREVHARQVESQGRLLLALRKEQKQLRLRPEEQRPSLTDGKEIDE